MENVRNVAGEHSVILDVDTSSASDISFSGDEEYVPEQDESKYFPFSIVFEV